MATAAETIATEVVTAEVAYNEARDAQTGAERRADEIRNEARQGGTPDPAELSGVLAAAELDALRASHLLDALSAAQATRRRALDDERAEEIAAELPKRTAALREAAAGLDEVGNSVALTEHCCAGSMRQRRVS